MNPGATMRPCASIVFFALDFAKTADGGDASIADGDVACVPRRAGAIEDVRILDDDVECGIGRIAGARAASASRQERGDNDECIALP